MHHLIFTCDIQSRTPMLRSLTSALTALTLMLSPVASYASDACSTPAMIVFDGSASMAETANKEARSTRISEAQAAMNRALPLIAPYRRVGLIVYGPGKSRGLSSACSGVDLRFAPEREAGPRIMQEVQSIEPAGLTALTDAVAQAAETLHYREKPALIVLVTDGNETCGGSPCQLAVEFAAASRDLTVHVIGFHVRASNFDYNDKLGDGATAAECLPALNGGKYVHTSSVETLADALEDTLGCDAVSSLPPLPRRRG